MSPKNQPKHDPATTEMDAMPLTSGYYSIGPDGKAHESLPPFETRLLPQGQGAAPVYEIWTQHTVYEFDRSMRCSAVRDAETGALKVDHPSLGAQLLGGRSGLGQLIHVSAPLPAVGHSALLGDDEHPLRITTTVTRVIMNLCQWSCASQPPRALEE